jgi:hypothetical protein
MNGIQMAAGVGLFASTVTVLSILNSSILSLPARSSPLLYYSLNVTTLVILSVVPLSLYFRGIMDPQHSAQLYLYLLVGLEIGAILIVLLAFTGYIINGSFGGVYPGIASLVFVMTAFDLVFYGVLAQLHQRQLGITVPRFDIILATRSQQLFAYFSIPGIIGIIVLVGNSYYAMATAVAIAQVSIWILAVGLHRVLTAGKPFGNSSSRI